MSGWVVDGWIEKWMDRGRDGRMDYSPKKLAAKGLNCDKVYKCNYLQLIKER